MQKKTKNVAKPFHRPHLGIDQMLKNVKKVLISGMGGGGDILTALHVSWSLEKMASHIEWLYGGVTGSAITHFKAVEEIDDVSAWVTEKSSSKPPYRLIETVVAKELKGKIFLLSCFHGVKRMVKSLNELVKSEQIEMIIFIDGGTDSLAFLGSSVVSPTEDTMAIAALGLGEYVKQLKHRVVGVSVVGSDMEMTLKEIGIQLMKISRAGGYIGGTFFPVERLLDYAELLSKVLQEYPTATAQAPLIVTNTPFKRNLNYPFEPDTNGFQLASFLFDAQIAAEVGNDFTHIIFDEEDLKSVGETIFNTLQKHRKRSF